jgi:hypothetical protein
LQPIAETAPEDGDEGVDSLTTLRKPGNPGKVTGFRRFRLDDVLVMFEPSQMAQALDTLGKAVRHNMLVVATCRDCEREARFLARDLATFYGHGRDPHSLKFRCTACDRHNCKITMMDNPYDRTPETIVWRPVKVKL